MNVCETCFELKDMSEGSFDEPPPYMAQGGLIWMCYKCQNENSNEYSLKKRGEKNGK